ncbi:hypothetical protein DCF75_10860 [Edwardsiella tarda]|uniref:hypothetical protein n=1 Tax=Edwardsiella tarda TaxID=636 RepID=UPI0010575A20|nr:hypothetical protein [Edwardsiella tarda]UCQ53250.1 hypothetical protein DCF75_10860 [Edwardsiella tarda]
MRGRKINILLFFSIWCVLLVILGGAYKTPLGNISTFHIIFIWGVICLFFLMQRKRIGGGLLKCCKIYYLYLFFVSSLSFISLVQFSFFNIGDWLFIDIQFKRIIQIFMSCLFLAAIVNYVTLRMTPRRIFFSTLIFLVFLLIFTLIQLVDDSFRLWYLNLTAIDGYWYEWAQKSNRAIGLKAMAIWDTSIAYSILIFIAFSSYHLSYGKISSFWLFIYISILFILIILSGRTGLIFLICFFTLLSIKYKKYSFLVIFSVISIIGIVCIVNLFNSSLVSHVIDFAFELIINIFHGKLETNSTDDLLNNHLFIPHVNDVIFGDNIFIGDGDEIKSRIGRSSDSAFVINYVAYGFVGVFITSILAFLSGKMFFSYFSLKNKNSFYYMVAILCMLLSFGLYLKILVYVSATLLNTMIFVTICLHNMSLSTEGGIDAK